MHLRWRLPRSVMVAADAERMLSDERCQWEATRRAMSKRDSRSGPPMCRSWWPDVSFWPAASANADECSANSLQQWLLQEGQTMHTAADALLPAVVQAPPAYAQFTPHTSTPADTAGFSSSVHAQGHVCSDDGRQAGSKIVIWEMSLAMSACAHAHLRKLAVPETRVPSDSLLPAFLPSLLSHPCMTCIGVQG